MAPRGLITYYGFLSVFPILLVAASLLSTVLVNRPALRQEMVEALVPPALQATVNTALAAMPVSGLPLAVGIVGLLLSGTGVVFSTYETLNHLAGVPRRSRFHWFARYARVLLMVVVVLAGGLGVAALTVASGVLPDEPNASRQAWPRPWSCSWSSSPLPPCWWPDGFRCGPAWPRQWGRRRHPGSRGRRASAGSPGGEVGPGIRQFRDRRGIFALLYLVSQALLYAAEVAVVRHRRLWPRAIVTSRPTPADIAALTRWRPCRSGYPSSGSRFGSTVRTRRPLSEVTSLSPDILARRGRRGRAVHPLAKE